jgi:hypothetical protein
LFIRYFIALLALSIPEFVWASSDGIKDADGIIATSIERWPDGGIAIDLLVRDRNPALQLKDPESWVSIERANENSTARTKVKWVGKRSARISVIVQQSDNIPTQRATASFLKKLVASMHADSEIFLYAWIDGIWPLGNIAAGDRFSADRLGSVQLLPGTMPDSKNVAELSRQFLQFAKFSPTDPALYNSTLVIGDFEPPRELIAGLATDFRFINVTLVESGAIQVAQEVSGWITERTRKAILRIAICDADTESLPDLTVRQRKVALDLAPEIIVPDQGVCDLDRIIGNRVQFPKKIYFSFTPKQRAKYERIYAVRSKERFKVEVGLYGPGKGVKSYAHLRGKSTLARCARKSYTLDLPEDQLYRLLPENTASRYFLISMCQGRSYIKGHAAMGLWNSLGLFPLSYRYVELVIDGESWGIYLLLEKAPEALLRKHGDIISVLRTRFGRHEAIIETKFTAQSNNKAMGDLYHLFAQAGNLGGKELTDYLESRIDIDQILTHLAVASILQNGDYIDELWFIQHLRLNSERELTYIYSLMKWDPEDILSGCHYKGKFALQDSWGLTYCVESVLGKAVINNPEFFDRYTTVLERIMNDELGPGKFTSAVNEARDLLSEMILNQETLLKMRNFNEVEGITSTPDEAQEIITNNAHDLIVRYKERRKTLIKNLKQYRGDNET